MKKYPKLVQCDKRGQIVIPKDMREELGIDESSGFWMFSISKEGILLKLANPPELSDDNSMIKEIKEKADKLKINSKNIKKSIESYKKSKGGRLEEL